MAPYMMKPPTSAYSRNGYIAGILLCAIASAICRRSLRSRVSEASRAASGRDSTSLRSDGSTSWLVRTSKVSIVTDSFCAARRAVSKLSRLRGLRVLPSTASRDRLGITSFSSSRRFSSSSTFRATKPVMFVSGRARLETMPVLTASPATKTTGIVAVARFAASAAGVPQATIKSTGSEVSSDAKAGYWSSLPSAKRYSMTRFWPSA